MSIQDYERPFSRNRAIKSEMLRLRFAAYILPALLLAQPAREPEARKLLVICVAGLDARFLAQPPSRLKIPNIRKLIREGAVAAGVTGVAPSDTAESEMSLVTGAIPAEQAPTLWQAVTKVGLKAATVSWPGSAGAGIALDLPPGSENASSHTVDFESVAGKASPSGIVDVIEKAYPGFEKEFWDDASAARAAVWIMENRKADVILVSLGEVDSLQRETAALGLYARQALENDDDLIGQMLVAAGPGYIVALVSGHGFENENYIVRPRVLLKQAHIEGSVDVQDGLIGARDSKVAARLRNLMNDGHRHGLAREVPMAEVKAKAPALSNWVAAFDTPANYVASSEDHGAAIGPGTHHGVSGLWPDRSGYRSVFVIAGAGVHQRKLGEIDLLQIAPTLADAIGVRLSQARASSLWPSISR